MAEKGGTKILVIFTIYIILISIGLSGCVDNNNNNSNDEQKTETDWRYWPINQSSVEQESGYSNENSYEVESFYLNENYISKVFIELTWEDEPSVYTGGTNEPDSFQINIITSWQKAFNSEVTSNPLYGEGQIIETIVVPKNNDANNSAIGEWSVNIHCVNCGEDISNDLLLQATEDSGNSWVLKYYYEYHSNE
jgi:hypothetical protein